MLRHLRKVASDLQAFDLRAFDLRAGMWISFEVPLVCAIKDNFVLFQDDINYSHPHSYAQPYPPGSTRLVLHGSARNLVMECPPGQVNEQNVAPHTYLPWSRALDALAHVENAAPPAPLSGVDPNHATPWDSVVQLAYASPSTVTTAMMRGYARLSIEPHFRKYGGPVVVASPLIVEFAR